MNQERAHRLAKSLKNKKVGPWTVSDLLGFGKSAAVFGAQFEGREAALKVFDSEIVERYGKITQLSRIKQEVSLSNHRNSFLVNIYEGGECGQTGHLYLAMERVDAPTLDSRLEDIPRDDIRRIIGEIARAARFLESLALAHRDIKPANIVVASDRAILLDLGVLRAIASPCGTDDDDARRFVGTLQYSPPEFLLREEEDSIDGWRAVTFYQLGAVLHDLIERKPIFSEAQEPYARLVNAVQQDKPVFSASDVPLDLIALAENCLIKDPAARLELVSWEDFERTPTRDSPIDAARKSIRNRLSSQTGESTSLNSQQELAQVLRSTSEDVRDIVRDVCVSESTLSPLSIHELRFQMDKACFTLTFAPNQRLGLNVHLHLEFVVVLVDLTSNAVRIGAAAWVGADQLNPAEDQSDHQRIYAGSIRRDRVEEAVLNYALPAFARALTLQSTASQGESRIPIENTVEGQEE